MIVGKMRKERICSSDLMLTSRTVRDSFVLGGSAGRVTLIDGVISSSFNQGGPRDHNELSHRALTVNPRVVRCAGFSFAHT